jgi:hypothetical protein
MALHLQMKIFQEYGPPVFPFDDNDEQQQQQAVAAGAAAVPGLPAKQPCSSGCSTQQQHALCNSNLVDDTACTAAIRAAVSDEVSHDSCATEPGAAAAAAAGACHLSTADLDSPTSVAAAVAGGGLHDGAGPVAAAATVMIKVEHPAGSASGVSGDATAGAAAAAAAGSSSMLSRTLSACCPNLDKAEAPQNAPEAIQRKTIRCIKKVCAGKKMVPYHGRPGCLSGV